jgi:signal transduction histidine kinase
MKRNDLVSDLDIIEFRHWILEQFLALQRTREQRITAGGVKLFESSLDRAHKIGLKGVGYLLSLLLPSLRNVAAGGQMDALQFESLVSWSDRLLSLAHGQMRPEATEGLIDDLVSAGLITALPNAFSNLILERLKTDASATQEWVLVLSAQAAKQHSLILAKDECLLLSQALAEINCDPNSVERIAVIQQIQQVGEAASLLDLKEFGVLFQHWLNWLLDQLKRLRERPVQEQINQTALTWQGFFKSPGLLSGLAMLDAMNGTLDPLSIANARRQLNFLQVIETRLRSISPDQLEQIGLPGDYSKPKGEIALDVERDVRIELQALGRQLNRELNRQNLGQQQRISELIRLIHTMKASAQLVGFDLLANDAHLLEDALLGCGQRPSGALLQALARQALSCEQIKLPAALQYHNTDDVDAQQIAQLALQVAQAAMPDLVGKPFASKSTQLASTKSLRAQLLQLAHVANTVGIERLAPRLQAVVEHAAGACNKEVQLHFEAPALRINLATVQALEIALTHLLRNCVDHGIESPDDRLALGKPRAGQIFVIVTRHGSGIKLTVSDDGAGLTDPAANIFDDGFSSALQPSPVSGRGYGLSIAAAQVKQLSGSIRLGETALGRGCRFDIELDLYDSVAHWTCVELGPFWLGLPSAQVRTIQPASDFGPVTQGVQLPWQGRLLPVISLDNWVNKHFGVQAGDAFSANQTIWHIEQGVANHKIEYLLLAPAPSVSCLVFVQAAPKSAQIKPVIRSIATLEEGQIALSFELSALLG